MGVSRALSPFSFVGLFLSVAIAWLAVTSLPPRIEGPLTDSVLKQFEKNPEYQVRASSGINKPVSAPQPCRDLSTTRWISVLLPAHARLTVAPLLLQSEILLPSLTLVGVVEFRI
jgi:hypothetical protein